MISTCQARAGDALIVAMKKSAPRTPAFPKAPRDLNPAELEKIVGGIVSPRDPASGLPGKP
jgi:hypothetical protein